MTTQQLLKIVYALDIKFWVRWCTCSMWRMLSVERSETHFHIYYVYIRTYVSNTRARVSDLR